MKPTRWKTWLTSLALGGTAAGLSLFAAARHAASDERSFYSDSPTNRTIPQSRFQNAPYSESRSPAEVQQTGLLDGKSSRRGSHSVPPQAWGSPQSTLPPISQQPQWVNSPAYPGLQLSNWPTRTGVQAYSTPIAPYAGYRNGNDPVPYVAARNVTAPVQSGQQVPSQSAQRGVIPAPFTQPAPAYSPIQHAANSNLPNITPPWEIMPNAQRSEAIDLVSFETGIKTAKQEVIRRDAVTSNLWRGPEQRALGPLPGVHFDNPYQSDRPAEDYVAPYFGRTNGLPDQESSSIAIDLNELPAEFAPWWDAVINQPMRAGSAPSQNVGVESLTMSALEHSPQVTSLRIDPAIRETVICEEAAFFDWTAFLDTTYDDKNDPVGNTLTTGGAPRFSDRIGASRGGLRKRTINGGRFDVAQRLAWEETNSNFFVPNPQGQTRLELNFTQPLMRGAGYVYNQSRIVLAEVDTSLSQQEMLDKLQDHLVSVYDTYWLIYKSRAIRLQKERLLTRAKQIQEQLEARRGVDSIRRQVLRAQAAVASRKAEIARAEMAIRNAESRLRLLVNSPDLKRQNQIELLPADLPMTQLVHVSLKSSAESALQHRPDIKAAIQKMKGTSVQLNMSKNELLPKLDLVLSTYSAGLQGKGDTAAAFGNQFTDGRPGFGVGLLFEYPLGNRAASARNERREWEVAKALKDFEVTIETSLTDVEIAVREMETAYREMLARFQSMIAAETEASYLQERWRLLPGNDQTLSFLLEDVLDAQERVTTEEQDFVTAQVTYVQSLVRLKRAMGVLLSL